MQCATFSRSKANLIQASASSSGPSGPGRPDKRNPRLKASRARAPGLFEVKVVTPPPRSLGIYALPPLTHNGEEIDIDGQGYVVTSMVVQYKLNKGRYVRDHSRLDVTPTGRYFLNLQLDSLLRAKYVGPTGPQD
eukprot:CAMPEP_0202861404 /NCGR_PEP_ID=MMETSP1391-20130828/2817_1 /ASSEMBLY_ACC=CAM_ASM_000867 /TAXON_ID=1034604 /ORGANISM="Chlamydomonas leiostraca, Strain SAG 11-49" /LENGTH=134 /DNA_ID=CAMNT_0049540791 /DNA_START=98 /DNA_END=502 /DNA_ORIENTATION=-